MSTASSGDVAVTESAGVWPVGCFRDATVLVTGGTSGIGAAVAEAFCRAGASVIATGVAEAEALDASRRMPQCRAAVLDVRDAAAVDRLMKTLPELHHVVNCAGIISRGAEHDPEVFARVLDVNLTGTMRICTAARPLLARTGGTIVNTASLLSFVGGALVPGYAASKGGIAQLTKSLALAYAADGIRVNAIAPGWIATPFTKDLQQDEARSTAILSRTALKRWGRPEDLVGGVLYLASPLAGFVTGTVLTIDGGYLAG